LSGFRYGWLYLGVLAAAAISVVALATQLVAEIRRAPEGSYS
jgi:hypothetical protein